MKLCRAILLLLLAACLPVAQASSLVCAAHCSTAQMHGSQPLPQARVMGSMACCSGQAPQPMCPQAHHVADEADLAALDIAAAAVVPHAPMPVAQVMAWPVTLARAQAGTGEHIRLDHRRSERLAAMAGVRLLSVSQRI